MDDHPLDNPIWHALGGPHAGLGANHGKVRRYHPHFAPFAAWQRQSPEVRRALAEALPPGGTAVLFTTYQVAPVEGLETVTDAHLHQMVATDFSPGRVSAPMRELRAADVPAMLDLVNLTHPGPFAVRTIEMGRYLGIFDTGKLVAMAGERLRLDGFTEVSAVCTLPAHRGKGHAKALVSAIAEAIIDRGEVPFLGVLPSNASAIATYERLGFSIRCTLHLTVLRRVDAG